MLNMPDIRTDKEAYEFVMEKLLEQGEKSIEDSGDCQYRGYSSKALSEIHSRANQAQAESEDEDDLSFYEELINLLSCTPPDAKCAAGFLIDDNIYSSNLEGQTVDYENSVFEAIQKSNPLWRLDENSAEMLKTLQLIHDQKEVDQWGTLLDTLRYSFDIYGNFMPVKG